MAEYWSADQIAECLPVGADSPLYYKLWNTIVPAMEAAEAKFVGDNWSDTSIKNWWHLLSEEEQRQINQLLYDQDTFAQPDEGED
jgi:hypothetical protein